VLPIREHLAEWRDFIVRHSADPAYAETLRKRPTQAFYLLLPYLVLRATGFRASYYEDTVKRLHRWGYLRSIEMVPYRILDRQYFLWKSGYLRRESNWQQLYRNTILGRSRNVVYLDQDAAYSITHTLFYLTDLGSRPPAITVSEVKRVTRIVECLLVHYWRLGNWDLVGELLINLNCLGMHQSLFWRGASRAFLQAWRGDGAVPANGVGERELASGQGLARDTRIFPVCYHTTLVGMLYCLTALDKLSNGEAIPAVEPKERDNSRATLA
jgi:hypothetical protein